MSRIVLSITLSWLFLASGCQSSSAAGDPLLYSNIRKDEMVQYFRTGAYLNEEQDAWRVPVHAWVYEFDHSYLRKNAFLQLLAAKYNLRVTPDTQENLDRRLKLLMADNERSKKLVIELEGRIYELPPTAATGQVRTELEIPIAELPNWQPNQVVTFSTVLPPEDERKFKGEVLLSPNEGLHLLSDIDDTVKVTGVTNRSMLLDKTFFQTFDSVPGMARVYRALYDRGIPLHFVSSSPWQLYAPLSEFLTLHGFPPATFNLKTVRFRDRNLLNLFKKGIETKPLQMEQTFSTCPGCEFLLIGDNGEYDPEVYADLAAEHGDRVKAVAIRDVKGEDLDLPRYKRLVELLGPEHFLLFDEAEQLASWLETLKLLPPGAVQAADAEQSPD